MAVTTRATKLVDEKHKQVVIQATDTMVTNKVSLFSEGQAKPDSTSTRTKRKINDPNLQIVKIDKLYDLTLIVGTPEHPSGQKAYQVNKGSFRQVSDVWSAMLSGNWAESEMSEISFPDDSCYAFHIVLRIAHWQFQELPVTLTQNELVEIAMLSDKYNLGRVLRAASDVKEWLQPYKGTEKLWPANVDLQDLALIPAAFGYDVDYQYLVNKLAMSVRVEKETYYYTTRDKTKVQIRSDLPPHILGK
jgi:hypothetical protein